MMKNNQRVIEAFLLDMCIVSRGTEPKNLVAPNVSEYQCGFSGYFLVFVPESDVGWQTKGNGGKSGFA